MRMRARVSRLPAALHRTFSHLLFLLYPFYTGLEPGLLHVHTLGSLQPAAHVLHACFFRTIVPHTAALLPITEMYREYPSGIRTTFTELVPKDIRWRRGDGLRREQAEVLQDEGPGRD